MPGSSQRRKYTDPAKSKARKITATIKNFGFQTSKTERTTIIEIIIPTAMSGLPIEIPTELKRPRTSEYSTAACPISFRRIFWIFL